MTRKGNLKWPLLPSGGALRNETDRVNKFCAVALQPTILGSRARNGLQATKALKIRLALIKYYLVDI